LIECSHQKADSAIYNSTVHHGMTNYHIGCVDYIEPHWTVRIMGLGLRAI